MTNRKAVLIAVMAYVMEIFMRATYKRVFRQVTSHLDTWRSGIRAEEFNRAVVEIRQILQQKEKVFLEPVTITTDQPMVVSDSVFLGIMGTALTIDKPDESGSVEITDTLREAPSE